MKKLWVPILMSCAAIVGLYLGRLSVSTNNSLRSDAPSYEVSDNFFSNLRNSKLQSVSELIRTLYVDDVDMDSIEESIIPDLLAKLDPHSVYIPRSEVEHVAGELKSNFGGIGVTFSVRNDTVNVMSVVTGGPSAALGVLPGDKIIKVNGYDFVGKKVTNQAVMDSLRGEIGTHVSITVLRRAGSQVNFDIVRGNIPLTSVDISYQIAPEVGYMKIDRFAEKTYEEMLAGIAKLRAENCKSLIVDLRGNGGGFLHVVSSMCNEFLDKDQLIVYTEGQHQRRVNTLADGTGTAKDLKLVVLIDEFSASASEIFSGAMQDNDRGLIIGRRSFGKGLVQSELQLPDGSGLRLTVARYHTPSGRCIQRTYADGVENYYTDVNRRLKNGELFSSDSIKSDTLQTFRTLKGRTVYGGGGIVPDIFVPYDSASASAYLVSLRAKRIIYEYALSYVDGHRAELKKLSVPQLINTLLSKQFVDDVTSFAEKYSVRPSAHIDSTERKVIDNETRAYIAQAIVGNDAFFPILNTLDPVVERALAELNVQPIYRTAR